MAGDRGRLTITDLAGVLVSIAFIGALAPVFYDGLDRAAGYEIFGTGAAYLWQVFMPLAAIVLLGVIYAKASAGGGA